MDNSLQDLENELKALRPRPASSRWLQQINRELAAELPASPPPRYVTATNLASWKWLGWRTALVAAALAVAMVGIVRKFRAESAVVPSPGVAAAEGNSANLAPVYEPVAATNVLYEVKDEGAVTVEGTTSAARRVRARYVDTYTWKNPRNNSSIRWTVPRDEIRVLPASYISN